MGAVELESILDSILEGFQIVDHEYRYVYLNETAARHGRATRESLLGRTMMEAYPGFEHTEVFSKIKECMETRRAHRLENRFEFPDGTVGFFELRIERVARGVCVLSIDVSERRNAELAHRRAEERLAHVQRMEAVGQLAAGIAHDFNNLITIVMGQGELALARKQGPLPADLETIIAAARSASALTRQLLTFGRRTTVSRESLDVAEVMRSVEALLRRTMDVPNGPTIDLRVEHTGSHYVLGDRGQLEQVLLNLVINARDAIEQSGVITVSASDVELDDSAVMSHPEAQPGRYVVLAVHDTGCGMDAETASHVFEPFFTTKERGRGTGLGLSTVYGIVKQHEGNVWLYSEVGKGATFKVYLPSIEAPASARSAKGSSSESNRPSKAPNEKRTILVAEDAPLLRKLLEAVLTSSGAHVLTASTGSEALELFEANANVVSALITDMVMPGLPGPELVARVRKIRPDLPVICTSGYSDRHLQEKGVLPDNVAFVEKPFSPKVLVQVLDALLEPK